MHDFIFCCYTAQVYAPTNHTDTTLHFHVIVRTLAQFLQQSSHAHSTLGTPGVFVVATASDPLHRQLLCPSAFAEQVAMPDALDQSQRLAVCLLRVCATCMYYLYVHERGYVCLCV